MTDKVTKNGEKPKKRRRSPYFSQWAAQFYVGAELSRRQYLIAYTLGVAEEVDVFVRSPAGRRFCIDSKGLSSKNFWLVRETKAAPDLYYVLVYAPPPPTCPQFFILKSAEMQAEIELLKRATIAAGKEWKPSGAGIKWKTALRHEDRWDKLPK